ncbi:hypothetical protein QZH41_006310 [Actinostola sp. cb2023]|nr:hypothetical protein QZH41_006310 [Actinostola sp. cb2023]
MKSNDNFNILLQIRILELPSTETVCRIPGFNKDDSNSIVTDYYQSGPASVEEFAMMELLVARIDAFLEEFQGILEKTKEEDFKSQIVGSGDSEVPLTNGTISDDNEDDEDRWILRPLVVERDNSVSITDVVDFKRSRPVYPSFLVESEVLRVVHCRTVHAYKKPISLAYIY